MNDTPRIYRDLNALSNESLLNLMRLNLACAPRCDASLKMYGLLRGEYLQRNPAPMNSARYRHWAGGAA